MEELVDDGIVRDIGVSNFRISDLQRLLEAARYKVHQLLCSLLLFGLMSAHTRPLPIQVCL